MVEQAETSEVDVELADRDAICPVCLGVIINCSMFEPRDGIRRYFGWCSVCNIGFEVEQRRSGQGWQILRYRVPMRVEFACHACRVEADWRVPEREAAREDARLRQTTMVTQIASVLEEMVETLRNSVTAMKDGLRGSDEAGGW